MAKTASGDQIALRERAERSVDRAIAEQRISPLRRAEWIERFEADPDVVEKVLRNLNRKAVTNG